MKHFENLTGKLVSAGGEDGLSISPSRKVAKVVVKNKMVDRIPLPNGKAINIIHPVGRVTGLPRDDGKTIKIVTPEVYIALQTWRPDVVTAPGIEKGSVREFYQYQPLQLLQLRATAALVKRLTNRVKELESQVARKQVVRWATRALAIPALVVLFLLVAPGRSGERTKNGAAEIRPPAVQRTVEYQKPAAQKGKTGETKKEERKTQKQKRLSRQNDKIMTISW